MSNKFDERVLNKKITRVFHDAANYKIEFLLNDGTLIEIMTDADIMICK